MSCKDIKEGFLHIDRINELKHNYTKSFDEDRKELRDKVIELFKNELPGKGIRELSTRVVYCVESVDGKTIYLKRPAPLNNGFDFEVHVSDKIFFGRQKTRLSHNCIFILLTKLKQENIEVYEKVQLLINELYNCNETNLDSINYEIHNIKIELILKCIKWLFVEQDITYWSYSGRKMFYEGLKNV